MRTVVGTASGNVDQSNPKRFQKREQAPCFGEIGLGGIVGIDTEAPAVRCGSRDGHALPRLRMANEWDAVIDANSDPNLQTLRARAYGCDQFPQEARSVFKASAVLARAVVGTEEFVSQITVAVLEVNEIEPDLLGQAGGRPERRDDALNFGIGKEVELYCAVVP